MKFLMQALDAVSSGIIITNQMGNIVEVNDEICKIFGYSKKALINKDVGVLVPSLVQKDKDEHFSSFLENISLFKQEEGTVLQTYSKTGGKLFVQVSIKTFEENGAIFCAMNIVDVSETYRMEGLIEKTQEVAKIGSWQVDLTSNSCLWSKMTYEIHELDPTTKILVEDGINFYTPGHRETIRKLVEMGIQQGQPWDVELKIITTKGKEKWVRAIGSPIIESNQVTGLQGTFQDINEQKLQREEIEQTLAKLQRTESIAKIGHWQWTLEPESIEWSDNLFKIFGLPPDSAAPTIAEHANWIVEADHELFFSSLQKGIDNKEAYGFNFRAVVNEELKHLRGEGNPIFDNQGVHTGFFGTCQDITEQTKAEQNLQSLTNRLTLALQTSNVGIWEWIIPTNELIWDDQMYALYGIQEKDFSGAYEAWSQGLHPDDSEASQTLIQDVIAGTATFDTEFRVVQPNGAVRYLRALATLERDESDNPLKMVGVNWDITKIKEYERELVDANTSLSLANEELMQFAYRSSHDLKSPLIAIKGLSEIMHKDLENKKHTEVKRNLDFVKTQADTLISLVNDLLDLAKADVASMDAEFLDIDAIINEVISINATLAKVNGVDIQFSVNVIQSRQLPTVRVLQIINNLVSNSIKYCDFKKDERFVKITVSDYKDSLKIVVEDNGTGIKYSNKKDVFEMFKRFHSKKISGSGLGMHLLRKHLDAMNGEIDFITSKEGSTFTLFIPALLRRK